MRFPSIFNLICFVHKPLHLPHSTLSVFETGGLWYFRAGHLLGTLHATRTRPNLFDVGEENEPGWGHCSTDPRRQNGVRSTLETQNRYIRIKNKGYYDLLGL